MIEHLTGWTEKWVTQMLFFDVVAEGSLCTGENRMWCCQLNSKICSLNISHIGSFNSILSTFNSHFTSIYIRFQGALLHQDEHKSSFYWEEQNCYFLHIIDSTNSTYFSPKAIFPLAEGFIELVQTHCFVSYKLAIKNTQYL